jgi:hypothetical protein
LKEKKTENEKLRKTSRRKGKKELKKRRVGVRKVCNIAIFIQFINN